MLGKFLILFKNTDEKRSREKQIKEIKNLISAIRYMILECSKEPLFNTNIHNKKKNTYQPAGKCSQIGAENISCFIGFFFSINYSKYTNILTINV